MQRKDPRGPKGFPFHELGANQPIHSSPHRTKRARESKELRGRPSSLRPRILSAPIEQGPSAKVETETHEPAGGLQVKKTSVNTVVSQVL
jgi:hypothetical protein